MCARGLNFGLISLCSNQLPAESPKFPENHPWRGLKSYFNVFQCGNPLTAFGRLGWPIPLYQMYWLNAIGVFFLFCFFLKPRVLLQNKLGKLSHVQSWVVGVFFVLFSFFLRESPCLLGFISIWMNCWAPRPHVSGCPWCFPYVLRPSHGDLLPHVYAESLKSSLFSAASSFVWL